MEETKRTEGGPRDRLAPGITLAVLSLLVVALPGCGKSEAHEESVAERLGSLAGARQSPLSELPEELARIEAEGGLPAQLTTEAGPETAAAVESLKKAFPQEKVDQMLEKIHRWFPQGRFDFSPLALERAVFFVRQHADEAQLLQQTLATKGFRFPIDFRRGFADRWFVDVTQIGAAIEAFRIAELLSESMLDSAVAAFGRMLRIASHLDRLPHMESRLTAALIRQRAFLALEALCHDRRLERIHLEQAHHLLARALRDWPAESQAWIGDRAQAMITYEFLRAGRLDAVLTPEERQQFGVDDLRYLRSVTARMVDRDQLFYLQVMRETIDACAVPFYRRTQTILELRQRLESIRNTADYPLIAALLFLPSMEQAQQTMAEDRARTEGWTLATAIGAGVAQPDFDKNPATGKQYEVRLEQTRCVVEPGMPGEPPMIVPLLGEAPEEAR